MWMIKPLKNGKTAVIFDEGIFPQVASTVEGFVVTATVPTQRKAEPKTLNDIKQRIELNAPKLNTQQLAMKPVVKDVDSIEVFDDQKQGNIIVSTALEKIRNTYGTESPVYMKGFYNTIERKSGVPVSRIHKDRQRGVKGRHKSEYPYRKIDTVLSLIPADEVYRMVKEYEF